MQSFEDLYEDGQYETIVRQSNPDELNFEQFYIYLKALDRMEQLDKIIALSSKRLEASDNLDIMEELKLIYQLIRANHKKGNFQTMRDYVDRGVAIIDEINQDTQSSKNLRVISSIINTAGISHYLNGEFSPARKRYEQVQQLSYLIDDAHLRQGALINLGLVNQELGRYNQAISDLEDGLELARKHEDSQHTRVALSNLGQIYNIIGQIEPAEKYTRESLVVSKENNDQWGLAIGLTTLGRILLKQGKLDEAENTLKDSVDIKKEFDNPYQLTKSLFFILLLHIHQDRRGQARDILREIATYADTSEINRITIYYRIGEALYLKHSSLYKHKIKAEEKLKQIIYEDIEMESDIMLLAFLNLIELLLEQIRELESVEIEEEKEIIEEIHDLYDRLNTISKDQATPYLDIQLAYIQAHLSLVQLDFDGAQKGIDRAEKIAKETGLEVVTISAPTIDLNTDKKTNTFSFGLQESVNRIIHTLPRLKIMVALDQVGRLTFSELQDMVDLTSGNLANHCKRLIDVEYIMKQKEIVGDRFQTIYSLTPGGITAFNRYRSSIQNHLSP